MLTLSTSTLQLLRQAETFITALGGGTGIGPIARPIEHGLDSSTENGWQEFESYADLGVDPRRYVPLQVKEKRREIELQFRDAEKKLEASVQAELDKADAALGPAKNLAPLDVINRSLTIVGNALQQKNQKLLLNQKKITSLGAKNFLTRTAEEIGEQAVREGNINGPEAYMRFLDREMEGLTAAYNVKLFTEAISSLQIRMNTLTAAKASIEAAAANKAREQAAAEAKRKAEEQARQQAAIRAANTYAMPANGSVVATAAGRGLIQVAQGAASLAQAISDAIAVLGRVLVSAPSVMAVGFASLTYSSRTAEQWQDQTPDSVRYALGMDAAKLGLPPSVNLNAVAKASGTVDLPMRLTNEARGSTTTLSVVSTDGVSVPKAVPVRMAAYNTATGLYEVTVPSTVAEAPPLILTWTPASPPGNQNPSSTTPVVPKPVPVYEGAALTPVKTEPESYPGVLLDLNDLIVIFPADSGVKPVYVMLSSPLDSGIFTRRQLQKKFDSHKYDFGLGEKSANNGTLAEFRDKILEHLADPATVEKGTYHSEVNSKVHYNARTNIVVIIGEDGMFVSGWRIEPGTDQYNFYMKNEVL